jgi:hypothetical protein
MSHYYLNEAVLELPSREFVDRTLHGLEAKLPSGETLGVIVQRRPVEQGVTLRALVDESIELNRKRLLGFAVDEATERLAGGLPCIVLKTRWRSASRPLREAGAPDDAPREKYQAQAHVVARGQLLVFAVGGPLEERELCDATLETVVGTLTWRAE